MSQHPRSFSISDVLDKKKQTIASILDIPESERLRVEGERRSEADRAFAAVSPLEQFFQNPEERPPGGVRGGAEGILPTLESAFVPTEEELAQARAREGGAESAIPGLGGALLGGARRGFRTAAGVLSRLNPDEEFREQIAGGIEREKQAEAAIDAPLPARLASGLAEFGTEIALTPGASKLLALRAPRAATGAGRIATTALGEGAKFSALESGLSLIEGEGVEEAAKRGQHGFVAGVTIGGVLKGAGEAIGVAVRRGPEQAAQAILERNRATARQNLAETVELGQQVQPKIQKLREAEIPVEVSGKPPRVSDRPVEVREVQPKVRPPDEVVQVKGEARQFIDPETGTIRGRGREQRPEELGALRQRAEVEAKEEAPSLSALLRSEKGGIQVRPDPLEKRVPENLPPHSKRIQNQISVGEREVKTGFLDTLRSLYTRGVRRTAGLERITKKAGPTPVERDPGALARFASGSARRAETFVETGPGRLKDGVMSPTGGPGVKQILSPLEGQLNAFRRYEIAQRTVEVSKRDIKTGVSLADAQTEIANATPAIRKAHEQMVQYRLEVLQYLQDAGVVSPEAVTAMKELGEHYVPLTRVFKGRDVPLSAGAGLGKRVIHRLRGSLRRILDPIQSTVDQTRRLIQAADQNRVALELVELVERTPALEGLIEKLGATKRTAGIRGARLRAAAKARGVEFSDGVAEELAGVLSEEGLNVTDGIIRIFRNGESQSYRVAPEIAQAIKSLAPNEISFMWRVLGLPAQTAKTGITLAFDFMGINFARDTFGAFIQSKYGFRLGIDSFKGLFESIKGTWLGAPSKAYSRFALGGGGFSTARGGGDSASALLRRILPQSVPRKAAGELIHPVQLLKKIAQPFEEAARVGEFLRAEAKGASTIEAILAQQEVSINFLQGGSSATMQGLTHATAFLNPAIQSLDKFARIGALAVKSPKAASRLMFTAGTSVSLPSLYFWIAARDDQEINDLRKTNAGLIYWFTRGPGDKVYKIPKPFLYGQIFGTGMEAMLDKFADDDPEGASRFAKGVMDQTVSNVLPNALGLYVEQVANKTQFFGTPIVPKGLEGVEPRFQTQNHTGAIARKIGDKLNISPARIEAVYRGVTGTLGFQVKQAADRIVDQLDGKPSVPERTDADRLILRRFFARSPSLNVEPIRTFYDESSKTIEAVESLRVNNDNPEAFKDIVERRQLDLLLAPLYATTRREFSEARSVMETIRGLPDDVMTARRKRELINQIIRQMIEKARTLNKAARQARRQ